MFPLTTRTKYLIVKLFIAAGLTTGVILALRYYIAKHAEQEINLALEQSAEQIRAVLAAQSQLPQASSDVQRAMKLSEILETRHDSDWATRLGELFTCEVSVVEDGKIVASSLPQSGQELLQRSPGASRPGQHWTVAIGPRRYEATSLLVSPVAPNETIVVMKSWAEIGERQQKLSRLLTTLAIAATLVGFPLVLRVSDTFGRPLNNLVGAVRALEAGDYNYPVMAHSHDELEEVTQAFEHMRASLQKSQKQLLQKERLATIGEMASSISHDLRHSLTTIIANAEFLAESKSGEENKTALYQEIRMAVEQMNELIESLLEFSRGRETPRLLRVNPADVVERALRVVRSKAGYQHIQFTEIGPDDLECEIDPVKVERGMVNLLVNACEAVSAESGKVEVRWENRNRSLQMRVVDNGPGVADDIRAELFQPFVSHGKAAGTGLGLAIVRKICEEHAGSVTLESSEPGRTIFCMTLPQSG